MSVNVFFKNLSAAGLVAATLACAVATSIGCGSSSGSSSNAVALCQQNCDKAVSCLGLSTTASASCKSSCAGDGGTTSVQSCPNANAILSAVQSCLAMACPGYTTCIQQVPSCQGGGTGGSSGAGGAGGGTGTGGAGGSAAGDAGTSCEACVKADTCCNAVGASLDAGSCAFAQTCNGAAEANRGQLVTSCTNFTTSLASLNAACQ